MQHPPETLGAALRRWRDGLSPSDAGLGVGRARRAAGLRREELAGLAGLSVDYVVRLEQGRATHPSAQVAAALARALQLDMAARDHLFRLAGLLPPADGEVSTHVPPGVARIVARLGELPVGVFSADWNLLSWSPLWAALLGDPAGTPPADRSLVRAAFPADDPDGDPARVASWPVEHADGSDIAAALVADLRHAAAAYPRDRRLAVLIAGMRARSRRFAGLWDTGAVGVHTSARKTVRHPAVGPVTVDCDVLTVPGSDIRLVVYSAAAGSPDADLLDFLRVAGPLAAAAR